jgi:Outer membrane protein beta-barrel domain
MPRSLNAIVRAAWFGLVILAGTSQSVLLRAEPPTNPLRPAPSPTAVIRVEPTGEVPPEPPSIVPPNFGEPELLQSDSGKGPLPPMDYAATDLSLSAPFQNFVHPWFEEPWFSHGDPNDPRRHIGIGQPLTGTSWRNRPLFFGTFVGGVMMDDLVPNRIYQNDTTIVGARLGYDFDHFWGLEGRWAFARPDLADGAGVPFFPASRDNFADVSLVWYPLGDARWRPYALAGIGFTTFRFNNELGQRISEAAVDVPLGFGVKYFSGPWFTLRFDFVDNLCLGNARVSGMHNVSLMAGAEIRFGGRRPSYFPWHNNTTYW